VDRRLGAAVAVITPSPETPSNVTPVAGSYIGAPAGLLPKYHAPATPASRRSPGRRPATASTLWSWLSAP
jgi:hypothetical protein